MSELTITLLRLGYLVLLWLFVLVGDRRAAPRPLRHARGPAQAAAPPRPSAAPRPPRTPDAAGRRTAALAAPSTARARLVVTGGPLRGTTVPLGSAAVLIGRAPSCTLVLDDDYSSQRHARLYQQGGQWYVEDLGSTNGTFLGRDRVEEPTPVGPGIQLRVGQSTLELQR